MSKKIFISGTDTGIGKTEVTASIAQYMRESGQRVITQKWVQTGADSAEDLETHEKIAGIKRFSTTLQCPYIFKHASSPHLAARLEDNEVDSDILVQSTQELSTHFDSVLIEGSGGLLVPLTPKKSIADVLQDAQIPTIIVARNALGTINHTLLSINELKRRDIPILGVVLNTLSHDEDPLILEDHPTIIEQFSGVKVLAVLPHGCDSWTRDHFKNVIS